MRFISVAADEISYIANRSGFLDLYSSVRTSSMFSQIRILCYHRVSPSDPPWYVGCDVKPDIFEKEILHLKKNQANRAIGLAY